MMKSTNGKGSKRRPENNDTYRENYDKIFKKKKESGTIVGGLYHPENHKNKL